jgi:hypothetical protein
VPAVVGFERKGQYTVPVLGGVVVLQEHAAVVVDAAVFMNEARVEAFIKKREQALLARWERLVVAAVSRERLRQTYGH